ncbi:glycosyltransferase family 8 protein [Devosia sp.]|uniref:glycosyltransferase family 8 protein n=1 Tax=Devosia sp. TaxID=1871048 RepID=UPI003A95A358
MADTVHIAFAVDSGYFKQASVTMASIAANAAHPERLRFHVIHAEEPAWVEARMRYFKAWNVSFVKAENPFLMADLGGSHVSAVAMMKTQLPELLLDLDSVIYVDADVVFTHDIEKLWNCEISDCGIAGVIDFGIYKNISRQIYKEEFKYRDYLISQGLDPGKMIYVNSGILYMNLAKLRASGFSAKARGMNSSYVGKRYFVDQDIINILVNGSVVVLDPRWNVLANTVSRSGRRRHHYIPAHARHDLDLQLSQQWAIHYAGPSKPWKDGSVWGAELWWKYAKLGGLDWPTVGMRPLTINQMLMEYMLDFRSVLSKFAYNWKTRS